MLLHCKTKKKITDSLHTENNHLFDNLKKRHLQEMIDVIHFYMNTHRKMMSSWVLKTYKETFTPLRKTCPDRNSFCKLLGKIVWEAVKSHDDDWSFCMVDSKTNPFESVVYYFRL